MSFAHSNTHMTVIQLIDRGWNPRLIKKYLGKEDLCAWLGQGRATRLYRISRIQAMEAKQDFREEMNLVQLRCKSVQQRHQLDQKKQKVIAIANEMPLPRLTLSYPEMLTRAWLSNAGSVGTSERVALDYLLGTMDSLGKSLNTYAGHPGVREARVILRNRFLKHVREHYPLLSGEIDQMMSAHKEAPLKS